MIFSPPKSPTTKTELLTRCQGLEGLSFAELSMETGLLIPMDPNRRKGWAGQAIEYYLGADAKNSARPDFQTLGVELKTLPLSESGKVAESTFVTAISLLTIHQEQWQSSTCYSKLRCVLWVPLEGDKEVPYSQRRIGRGFLWSPSPVEAAQLEEDWRYLTLLISTGQLECIDATLGEYLQVRPKAANGRSVCFGFDAEGNKVKTLPRGFYLRSRFTTSIFLLNSP